MSTRLRPATFLAVAASAASLAAATAPSASAAYLPPSGAYASFGDAYCYLSWQYLFPFWRYTQPTVTFTDAYDDDPNPPIRLDATATKDGKVVAQTALTQLNTTKNLDAGRFGGYTVGFKATLRNGTVSTTSLPIAAHPSPPCNIN